MAVVVAPNVTACKSGKKRRKENVEAKITLEPVRRKRKTTFEMRERRTRAGARICHNFLEAVIQRTRAELIGNYVETFKGGGGEGGKGFQGRGEQRDGSDVPIKRGSGGHGGRNRRRGHLGSVIGRGGKVSGGGGGGSLRGRGGGGGGDIPTGEDAGRCLPTEQEECGVSRSKQNCGVSQRRRGGGQAGKMLGRYLTVDLEDFQLNGKRRRPSCDGCRITVLADVHRDPEQDEADGGFVDGGGGGDGEDGEGKRQLMDTGGGGDDDSERKRQLMDNGGGGGDDDDDDNQSKKKRRLMDKWRSGGRGGDDENSERKRKKKKKKKNKKRRLMDNGGGGGDDEDGEGKRQLMNNGGGGGDDDDSERKKKRRLMDKWGGGGGGGGGGDDDDDDSERKMKRQLIDKWGDGGGGGDDDDSDRNKKWRLIDDRGGSGDDGGGAGGGSCDGGVDCGGAGGLEADGNLLAGGVLGGVSVGGTRGGTGVVRGGEGVTIGGGVVVNNGNSGDSEDGSVLAPGGGNCNVGGGGKGVTVAANDSSTDSVVGGSEGSIVDSGNVGEVRGRGEECFPVVSKNVVDGDVEGGCGAMGSVRGHNLYVLEVGKGMDAHRDGDGLLVNAVGNAIASGSSGGCVVKGSGGALVKANRGRGGRGSRGGGRGGVGEKRARSGPALSDEQLQITPEMDIEPLWMASLLGHSDAEVMLNTLFLINSIYFRLVTMREHVNMLWGDVQCHMGTQSDCYLQYRPLLEKDHPNAENDSAPPKIFANVERSDRCPVQLYLLYSNHRPEKMCVPDAPFYLSVNTSRGVVSTFKSEKLRMIKLKCLWKNLAKILNVSMSGEVAPPQEQQQFPSKQISIVSGDQHTLAMCGVHEKQDQVLTLCSKSTPQKLFQQNKLPSVRCIVSTSTTTTEKSHDESISTATELISSTDPIVNATDTREDMDNRSTSESELGCIRMDNNNEGFTQGSVALSSTDSMYNSVTTTTGIIPSTWCPEHRKYTESVIYFLTKDNLPLNTVEKPGFKHMLKVLNSSYKLPDVGFFSKVVLPRVYNEIFQNLLEILHKDCTGLFAMTAQTRKIESEVHMYFMVHYIDVNWNMHRCWLHEEHCSSSGLRTEELDAVLKHVLMVWRLKAKNMVAFTTDLTSDIVNTCALHGSYFVPCVNWCLSLAIHKGLNGMRLQNLVEASKVVARKFAGLRSAPTQGRLEREEHMSSWIETLELLQEMHHIYTSPLDSHSSSNLEQLPLLDLQDLDSLQSVVLVLQALRRFVVELACEPHVPASAMEPLLQHVKGILVEEHWDTPMSLCLKATICHSLSILYTDRVDTAKFLQLCTILDPRFRSFPMAGVAEVLPLALDEMNKVMSAWLVGDGRPELTPTGSSVAPGQATANDIRPSSFGLGANIPPASGLKSIFKKESGNALHRTLPEQIAVELEMYLHEPPPDMSSCPLMWWRFAEQRFPVLALLARACLCIPAMASSSTPALPRPGNSSNSGSNGPRTDRDQKLLDQIVFLSTNLP